MTDAAPPTSPARLHRRCRFAVMRRPARLAHRAAIALSFVSAALLVALSGHNPLAAFAAMAAGAVGSPHQIGVALNRATPYLLAGGGVADLLSRRRHQHRRGRADRPRRRRRRGGRAALAGSRRRWPLRSSRCSARRRSARPGRASRRRSISADASTRCWRLCCSISSRCLLVQQALAGPLGQCGAGFLQSPEMPAAAWLWQVAGSRRACRRFHRRRRRRRAVAHPVAHAVRLRPTRRRALAPRRRLRRVLDAWPHLGRDAARRRAGRTGGRRRGARRCIIG